jgi:hypothetical protein
MSRNLRAIREIWSEDCKSICLDTDQAVALLRELYDTPDGEHSIGWTERGDGDGGDDAVALYFADPERLRRVVLETQDTELLIEALNNDWLELPDDEITQANVEAFLENMRSFVSGADFDKFSDADTGGITILLDR